MQDSGIQVLFQGNNLLRILQGLGVTIEISILSVLLSMMFRTVMGIIMTSHSRIIRFLTRLYLEFIRIMPHLDVLQNLILGPIKTQGRDKKEVTEEALQLLDRVGLLDKQHSFARQLSGGQKQRVAIVRALLMHPEIILFDEVTASLDPEMVREVLELINDLAQEGRTMILVTHEMQFAQAIADRIIFLDQGKIAEEGTAQAFFTNPQTKRAQEFLNVFDFSQFGSYL